MELVELQRVSQGSSSKHGHPSVHSKGSGCSPVFVFIFGILACKADSPSALLCRQAGT